MEDKAYYKHKAKNFLKEYKVSQLSLDKLENIIESQGYKIIKYNTFDEVPSTEKLLNELGLKQYSQASTAFTYREGNLKLIFIDDTLLNHDKLYALLHEEGHIYCGHMDRYNCSTVSVEDEQEANEFAHYIMSPPSGYQIMFFLKKHLSGIVIIASVLILMLIVPFMAKSIQESKLAATNEYTKTLEYYVTESGHKYHTKDCRFIKNKEFVRKITEEEYESGLYEPCKECINE